MGLGLIVFDCDGVLIDSERLSMRGYQEVLADYGIEVSESLWARCLGRKRADILALIESSAGRSAPAEAADRLWPHIRRLFAAELRATAGLVEFLELSPVRRCVASSSEPGRIRFCLETTGLARYFGDSIFSSQDVAHGKPAPDIFLFAAARMGVDPSRVVVMEDSVPGVQAAIAAGARAIGYLGGSHIGPGHGERLKAAGAEFVAKDWRAAAGWLANA